MDLVLFAVLLLPAARRREPFFFAAGVRREQIVIDPGIGFGKTPEQSIRAVAQLAQLKRFGLPILIGLSRKRFISSIAAGLISSGCKASIVISCRWASCLRPIFTEALVHCTARAGIETTFST